MDWCGLEWSGSRVGTSGWLNYLCCSVPTRHYATSRKVVGLSPNKVMFRCLLVNLSYIEKKLFSQIAYHLYHSICEFYDLLFLE
jgi:hypothetical protein